MPIGVSDVSNVLNPIYESLKNICEDAARQPSEAVVMSCLRVLGDMAVHTMTIIHDQEGRKTAPLVFTALYYLDACAKTAVSARMDDGLLATIERIRQFFCKISNEVDTSEAEDVALKCLSNIATTSYSRTTTSLPCFQSVDAMLFAAKKELQVRGVCRTAILDTVLKNLQNLVSLEARMDAAGHRSLQIFPPYSKASDASLPALLADAANQVKPVDPDRSWIDPFYDFAEASEMIVHHYRHIAEHVSFEGALLEKWILDSVKQAADIHIWLLKTPPQGSEPFLRTVERRLAWFISVPSFYFRETVSFPGHHAKEAAGDLAVLGMELLRLGWLETAEDCGATIAAIGNKSAAVQGSSYGTADIFVNLEILALAASALGVNALEVAFRARAVPETVSEDVFPGYDEAIQTRHRQLNESLERREDHMGLRPDPVLKLREILQEASS